MFRQHSPWKCQRAPLSILRRSLSQLQFDRCSSLAFWVSKVFVLGSSRGPMAAAVVSSARQAKSDEGVRLARLSATCRVRPLCASLRAICISGSSECQLGRSGEEVQPAWLRVCRSAGEAFHAQLQVQGFECERAGQAQANPGYLKPKQLEPRVTERESLRPDFAWPLERMSHAHCLATLRPFQA